MTPLPVTATVLIKPVPANKVDETNKAAENAAVFDMWSTYGRTGG